MNVVDALKGKKTYIVAVLIAALNLAVAVGWVSPSHLDQINLVLGAFGLGFLRSGVTAENEK